MSKKKPVFIFLMMILLASLACSLPLTGSDTPAEDLEDLASTAVAATLTALAPMDEPITPIEVESPIETPIPEMSPTEISIKSKPDELRVAFVDTYKNLHVWQAGGSPTLIVNSGMVTDAVLSPDGEWIVYTSTTSDGIVIELWAIRFDGSDQKLLVTHDDFMAMPLHPDITDVFTVVTVSPHMLEFIPGTHTVAFSTYPRFDAPGLLINHDLWYIDVDTDEKRALLSPGQAGNFYFSPDGSQMVLVTPDRIDLLNTDGSNRRIGVLSYPFVYTYSEYAFHAIPIWSQDSSYLRVSIPPQDPLGDTTMPVKIYHLPIDGSLASLLTSVVVAPLDNAFLAPDLNHFAFKEQLGDPSQNLFSLKFSNLSGGSPVEFTNGSLGFGNWSTNSSHFTFFTWEPRQTYIGQVGMPGVILLDANPVMDFEWITSDSFLFLTQLGDEVELRIGTLATPSTLIANLGSGTHYSQYSFVHP